MSFHPLPTRRSCAGSWVLSDAGCLKFNVDAASLASFGEAGIGGILRYHYGKILIRFFKSIGISDLTGAELVAIHEACQVFSLSPWFRRYDLLIESDSLLAVSWIKNPSCSPPCFTTLVTKCHRFFLNLDWKICFDYRERNGQNHLLTREGIGRITDLLEISD
ncbi:hypothetical protein GQ457_08G025700 [Hibiscus cannabinus]